MENGFSGQAGETVPILTDDFVTKTSERYIELYEKLTGESSRKHQPKMYLSVLKNV